MSDLVPSQLASETPTFLRIAERSKAPKRGNSASDGPFYHREDSEIIRHLGQGGNLARVLQDDLVAFDIDSLELKEIVEDRLPDSFEIESGGEGTGFHRYYRSPEFEGNQIEFKDSGTEIGGLRSGNSYCLVPPSKHDETGNEYSVSEDREIAYLPADTIEKFVSEVRERTSQHSGGGGGGGGCVGSSPIPEIPTEYPEKPATWGTMKKWLKANGFLSRLYQTSSNDWSGLEFSVAKCLAEGGFDEPSIFEVLNRLNHSAKWHNKGGDYRNRTVRKAIVAACNDEFVSFGTGDMGASEASESHKTEESGEGRTLQGGENMTEFTEKETVQVQKGTDEGDRVVEAVRVQGQDGDDTFEFVSVRKGRIETVELMDGETGQTANIDQNNSYSLGSTADLEMIISALEDLREKVDER